MKIPKDQPFWTSVILHLVVLLALFLVTIVQAFKPKEKPHVFEMVNPPDKVSEPKQAAPQTPVQQAPAKLPPVPKVNIPKPSVPTLRTKEKPPPKAQIIHYRDFTKEHPKDKPKPRPVEKPRDINVHQIDVSEFINSRSSSSSKPSPQVSPQQISAYYSRLSSRIDAAWVKPPQLAGLRLAAKVVFDVSPSGQITNVQLRPGSGNKAFDQSILAAFRNVSSAGPTPTGQQQQFTFKFSSNF
ncbi:MAG: TonB family protein [Verrucomicrobiota bacterium]|nr:TonB family protein [Verrucomicrobiota bacterium]MEC7235575.1 TonB family protein [Verrucomicrobiota bacterium]MEE2988586.1 TonB family protein [Verrucomicrobiota bacterium]